MYEYIEINNDCQPEYYATYSCDKRQELRDFAHALKVIKSLGDLPDGIHAGRGKSARVERDGFIHRKRTNGELMHFISSPERTSDVTEVVDRLRQAFPDLLVQRNDECEHVLV